MKRLSLSGLGLLGGFLQGSLDQAWSFPGPCPDLLLLAVLHLGVLGRTPEALLVGFFGGIGQDLAAPYHPIGTMALCKIAAAYLPEWAHYLLILRNRATGWLLVAAGTLVQQLVLLAVVQTTVEGRVWGGGAARSIVLLLIWNAACWTPFAMKSKAPGALEARIG